RANFSHQGRRGQGGADHNFDRVPIVYLSEVQIHFRARLLFDGAVPHVAHHSDDTPVRAAHADHAANSFLTRPQTSGHGFVDDDYLFGVGRVACVEVTPGTQGNTHRLQIAMVDHTREGDGISAALITHAFGAGQPGAVATQGQRVGQTDRFHSWNGRDLLDE